MVRKTNKLRKLLEKDRILVIPGSYDVLSARVIEKLGFEALQIGSFNTAASLGMPDFNLLTMTEMWWRAKDIANAVEVPVIADIDTGYGNAINVMRTIREYESAGIAGVHMEDQILPKKFSYYPGDRSVISIEEMVGKIKAAKTAQEDDDFFVIARTEGPMAGIELGKVMERAKAYEKAGADSILMITEHIEDYKMLVKAISIPVCGIILARIAGTVNDLEEMGCKMALADCLEPLLASIKTAKKIYAELKTKGTSKGLKDEMISYRELFDLLKEPEIRSYEERFLPKK